jgi:hypothetical protein
LEKRCRQTSLDGGNYEYLIHWPGFDKGQEKFAYCRTLRLSNSFLCEGTVRESIMSLPVEQILVTIERNTNSKSFDVIKSAHLSLLSNSLVCDHDFTLAVAYLMEINVVISLYCSIT